MLAGSGKGRPRHAARRSLGCSAAARLPRLEQFDRSRARHQAVRKELHRRQTTGLPRPARQRRLPLRAGRHAARSAQPRQIRRTPSPRSQPWQGATIGRRPPPQRRLRHGQIRRRLQPVPGASKTDLINGGKSHHRVQSRPVTLRPLSAIRSSAFAAMGHHTDESDDADHPRQENHPMPSRYQPDPVRFWRGHPNVIAISLRCRLQVGALAWQGLMFRRICAGTALFILTFLGAFSVTLAVAEQSVPMIADLTGANDGSTIEIAVGASVNVILKVPEPEIYKAQCLWSNVIVSGDPVLEEEKKAVLLPTGVTAASFKALRPGAAQLRSSRFDCSKGLTIEWRVNVRVT